MELESGAKVRFLCSGREIDSRILARSGFDYTALTMTGFSFRPSRLTDSFRSFVKSYRIARAAIGRLRGRHRFEVRLIAERAGVVQDALAGRMEWLLRGLPAEVLADADPLSFA